MTTQIAIVLTICVCTFVLYLWNPYKSMGATAILAGVAFFLTGCVDAATVASSYGNTTAILLASMYVVGAGFNKTQFVKKLASLVTKVAKGSLTKVMVGYIGMAVIMCSVIPSNLIPFCILYPLLDATVRDMGYHPSKVMFPLGITTIITCQTFPIGSGAAKYISMNTSLEKYGSVFRAELLDPMIARLPLAIIIFIFCAFICHRLTPEKGDVEVRSMTNTAAENAVNRAQLPAFQEYSALVIFFGVTIMMFLASSLKIANWVIAAIGAAMMLVTRVINTKEATQSMNMWVLLVFVNGLIMASAISSSGAGTLVGDFCAGIVGAQKSNLIFYAVFFIGPFILTQFILNATAINIFTPIAITTCIALNANPVGAMMCVTAAGFSSFFTPMATGTVSYMMGAGGYSIKQLFKMSLLPTLICFVVTVVWLSIAFPVF